jgi:hypothetical protein
MKTDRPIGKSKAQNEALQSEIARLEAQGAKDIRVNQQQVDYNGNRVGVNRPGLQYSLDGKRYYREFESENPGRYNMHRDRLEANDPFGEVLPGIFAR